MYKFSADKDHRVVGSGYREAYGDEQSGLDVDRIEGTGGRRVQRVWKPFPKIRIMSQNSPHVSAHLIFYIGA